jgi:putative ABC transport system ATP-binding protein
MKISMTILQARGLAKSIQTPKGELSILNSVDLLVNQAESVAILGASGSGKTTLLGILAGLDLPSEGTLQIQDKVISTMDESQRATFRLEHVGFVFQNFELLPHLSALENVMLPLELSGKMNEQQQAEALLDQLGLMHRHQHYPAQLSGGEQQRVALARAYVTQPSILFADEPTGSLDEQTSDLIMRQLFDLNQQCGTTLIFITHDPVLAKKCDSLYTLREGRLTKT